MASVKVPPSYPGLPPPPRGSSPDLIFYHRILDSWWNTVKNQIELDFTNAHAGSASGTNVYIVSTTSTVRTLNVATVSTLADLANFVGTEVLDFKRNGILT